MNTKSNSFDVTFRSYDDGRDTDYYVNMNGDNVDQVKLMTLVNKFFQSIDCDDLVVLRTVKEVTEE